MKVYGLGMEKVDTYQNLMVYEDQSRVYLVDRQRSSGEGAIWEKLCAIQARIGIY